MPDERPTRGRSAELVAQSGQPLGRTSRQGDPQVRRRVPGEVLCGEPADEPGGTDEHQLVGPDIWAHEPAASFRALALARLLAFCSATTSSSLLILERPLISSRVASS